MKKFDVAVEPAHGFCGSLRDRVRIERIDYGSVAFTEVDLILFGKRFLISIRQMPKRI